MNNEQSGATPKQAPSRWLYVVGACIAIAGIGIGAIYSVDSVESVNLPAFKVPGAMRLQLKEVGRYTIFYEEQTVFEGAVFFTKGALAGMRCEVLQQSSRQQIDVGQPSMSEKFTIGGRSGTSVLQFRITEPGSYDIACKYDDAREGPQAVFSVGHQIVANVMDDVLVGFAIILSGVGAGFFLSVWVYTKRASAAKAATLETTSQS